MTDDRKLLSAVKANSPRAICKLLRAIAGGSVAIENRHDTILIAAAAMIEAYEARRDLRCAACESDD